jgi:hypothetical protein
VRGLHRHDAAEGRAHDRVVELHLCRPQGFLRHFTLLVWLETRAASASDCARAASSAEMLVSFRSDMSRWRLYSSSAFALDALASSSWALAAATWARAQVRVHARLRVVERREDVTASTRWPSSMRTSLTLPVIFAETVAWRRAVT